MPDLIYSRKLSNGAMGFGDIARLAPAAFSDGPIAGVSEQYGHITTLDVIQKLGDAGWLPVQAAQTNARTQSAREHTKHLIAFAREEDLGKGEGRPEIVAYNSSDRSSACKLYAGYYRWICSNSLVAGSGLELKFIHKKSQIINFDAMLESTVNHLDRSSETINKMRDTFISYDRAHSLGCLAANLRWSPSIRLWEDPHRNPENSPEDNEPAVGTYWTNKTIESFFRAKRYGEETFNSNGSKYSIWDIFNRVQEGLMRSGADVISVTKKSPVGSHRKARAIGSVSKAIKINRDCWDIFEAAAA